VIRAGGFSPVQIFFDTLSLFWYQTPFLICGRALAVSMLAARLFLFPGSELVLRSM
jgi:hypothetical protein